MKKMPERSNTLCAATPKSSDSPTERLAVASATWLICSAIVLAICKLEDTIGESASDGGAKASPKMDSGAIHDSMGNKHGGGGTSRKAMLSLKQTIAMSSASMVEIFIAWDVSF